jgi:uncharacterized protein
MNQPDTTDPWEAICRRCGECCFEKKLDAWGNVLTTKVPCRFLDIHTRLCRIYHLRHQAEEDCIKLTAENLPELDWLPDGCAYRQHCRTAD